MKIIAQINFSLKEKKYKKGEEIKNISDIDTLVTLNERGFIKKLSQEELIEYENNLNNKTEKGH